MARKKPDYAHINTPLLQEYCDANGLKWAWKNQAQGHMIIQSADFEAYVWVQRMTVQVRRRGGIDLSGSVATHMQNRIFNAADFTRLIGKPSSKKGGKKRPKPLVPHIKGGIVIVRVPHGTPIDEATKATAWARNLARKINKSHEKDHYYEKGW
jgi:hypothetical protein